MKKSAYEEAGVSIDRGNEAVQRIRRMAEKMGVKEIGKFGGFFPLRRAMKHPILVSSADGVGTKLKLAFQMDVHNTVGQDLVNHCINDILVYGAKPQFFLDYIAAGELKPQVVEDIVAGMLKACLENEFLLLGGETAEMPGFYGKGEYDLAGFIVGLVDKEDVVDGHSIRKEDLLIGLPSTGLHTNGYTLARHIFFDRLKFRVDSKLPGFSRTLGEELLAIHRSYLRPVTALLAGRLLKGMAHITGGGLIENIPRILADNLAVVIEKTWPIPEIFRYMIAEGKIEVKEAFRVFNMGIGMVLVIDPRKLSAVEKKLQSLRERFFVIGQVKESKGRERVRISK